MQESSSDYGDCRRGGEVAGCYVDCWGMCESGWGGKKEKESKREAGLLMTLSDDAFDKAVEGQMAAMLANMNAALPSSPQNKQMQTRNETRLLMLDNDEFEKAVEKEMVAAHVDGGSGEAALKKLQPPVIDNAVEDNLAQVDSMETDIGVGI